MHKIEISEKSYAYLQAKAVAFVDTPMSVLDRIIDEHSSYFSNSSLKEIEIKSSVSDEIVINKYNDFPSMLFTSVKMAYLGENKMKSTYWNDILVELVVACRERGIDSIAIINALDIRTQSGSFTENGFKYIPEADFSYQGLDADRASRAIWRLSKLCPERLEIRFFWQNNPKAAKPGMNGILIC